MRCVVILRKLPLISSFVLTINTSCTHTSPTAKQSKRKQPEEPVSIPQAMPTPEIAAPTPTPTPLVAATPSPTALPDCRAVPGFAGDEPVYVKSADAVLTRIAGPCDLPDGTKGHLPNGGWMAMGFPCTGGEGRINWIGTNYNAPKMVSFLLDTSCPMAPNDPNRLKNLVTTEIGVSTQAPLIAFNPFVVQYYEVPGYDDADATFSVDLRNTKSLSSAWSQFIKQKPLKVFLVGRENAWVPGNNMYAVDAELIWASKNRFTMKVLNARILKGDELAAVKARCEALKPERDCGKVF